VGNLNPDFPFTKTHNPQPNIRRQKTDFRRRIFRLQIALRYAPCPMFYAFTSTQRSTLYETTPKWHAFLMIRRAAFQVGGDAHMRLRLAEH